MENHHFDEITIAMLCRQAEITRGHEDILAPCQRAAMNPKYYNLFMDASLSLYIVGKIYALQKD